MRFKLKRIDWYIIKQFLVTYVFAIALIISISVVFDINEKIDKFLNPDVPLKAIIVDYYLNFIPYFANLFSPLFSAVMLSISRWLVGSSRIRIFAPEIIILERRQRTFSPPERTRTRLMPSSPGKSIRPRNPRT